MTAQQKDVDILVVEDSETQAMGLKRLLSERGYIVRVARNGAEGLSSANEKKPSLILSDILMPVMDGFQMCRELKADPGLRDIPVLLLTQLVEPEEVIRGLEVGADNYITKPFDAEYLLLKVKAMTEKPDEFRNRPDRKCIEFTYMGKHYSVHSGRTQTLTFLLSTYENAIRKNKELVKAQEELTLLNEQLEHRVNERTESLTAEVAERKQAEKALRESEERFRAVVESASDAVICLEPPGKVYLWNTKAEEMFGYHSTEAIGRLFHDLVVPGRYRPAANDGMEAFFQSGEGPIIGKTIEMEALRKDGSEFPVELSVSAVNLHGIWNSIGIIRDISERKKLEKEMKENLDEVERMNRLMVGRELKMEELRERIKALDAKVRMLEGRKAV